MFTFSNCLLFPRFFGVFNTKISLVLLMKIVLILRGFLEDFCLKIVKSVHSNTSQAHAGKSFSKVLMTQVLRPPCISNLNFAKTSEEKYELCTNISTHWNLYKHLWTIPFLETKPFADFWQVTFWYVEIGKIWHAARNLST